MSTEDRLNTNLDAMADAILNSRSPGGAAVNTNTPIPVFINEDDYFNGQYVAYALPPVLNPSLATIHVDNQNNPQDAITEILEALKLLGLAATEEDLEINDETGDLDADKLDEEDEEPTEPEEEDYVMTPGGYLGGLTEVYVVGGNHVGYFHEEEWAVDEIRRRMEKDQFWPNVWFQDDHGGFRLINLAEEYPA